MPLPRTDTLELQDWCVSVSAGDQRNAGEFHIPLPFSGYLERFDWVSASAPNAPVAIAVGLSGGATLLTEAVPASHPAGVAYHSEYTQGGSPVQFEEGDDLIMNTDGLPTNLGASQITLVLKRL